MNNDNASNSNSNSNDNCNGDAANINSNDSVSLTGKKTNKCRIDSCADRVAKIVGECRYCERAFCSKHRLPESHACEKLSNCRQESYEKNSNKLLNGKCVADKL